MTDIGFDTEFLDDGKTLDLISIGLHTAEAEYYAVNADADWPRIRNHEWLCENVVPLLPLTKTGSLPNLVTKMSSRIGSEGLYAFTIDRKSSLVKPRWVIANEVAQFILNYSDPRLWTWYGSSDHVALTQLWGPLTHAPAGIPWFTYELKQEVNRLAPNVRLPNLPERTDSKYGTLKAHHALHDAREVLFRKEWLQKRYAPEGI